MNRLSKVKVCLYKSFLIQHSKLQFLQAPKTSDRELKNAISLLSLDFPCVNYLLDTENLGISFGALPLYTHMHA